MRRWEELNIALVQDGERMGVTGAPVRTVAGGAADFGEEPRTRLDLGGIGISRKGRSNSLQIEGQMTEHFVRDLKSVMAGTVAVRAGLTFGLCRRTIAPESRVPAVANANIEE